MPVSFSSKEIKIQFESGGIKCAGRLHLPDTGDEAIPCVVMANGFSGTMDWLLPSFAKKFADAGLAVLRFDYRFLGESDGVPRQIVDIEKQREDLKNAIEFVRQYKGIAPDKIALWGTSLGGSHVLLTASRDPEVAAVIANTPAIDAVKGTNVNAKLKKANASKLDLIFTSAKLLGAALLDVIKKNIGLSPHYIKVYGKPGKAFFTDPDLAANFQRVASQSPTWKNFVAPRFLFKVPRYEEGMMESIKIPILFTVAEKDLEVSVDYIRKIAAKAKRSEILVYPAEHFEMYHSPVFEQVANDQVGFLAKVFGT